MTVPTILIAGCGDVGGIAARLLMDGGHTVYGLRRRTALLPEGVHPVAADLISGAGFEQMPQKADSLVYMASANERTEAGYRQAYVDGLARMLATEVGQSAACVLFVSSTSVYGQQDGQWVDESSLTEPARFNGAVMLEAEQLVLGLAHGIVLRLGGIYGPGRNRLIKRAKGGAECVEEPPQYTNRIHSFDAAAAIVHLLALDEPAPIYLGVDSDPAPQHVVLDWMAERVGGPAVKRVAAGSSGRAGTGSKRCSNARLLASGFTPRYPGFRQGYGELLE